MLSIYAMIFLNNLVNTSQRMEQEKDTQILMKVNKQNNNYKNNFERTMRSTGK